LSDSPRSFLAVSKGWRLPGAILSLFAVPLVLILADVAIDKQDAFLSWSAKQWGVWSTGLAWDLSAWGCLALLLVAFLRSGHPVLRRAGGVLLWLSAFCHVLAIAVSAGYHAVFHHLPNIHALEFVLNETANAWSMFLDGFDGKAMAWFLLATPLFGWLHVVSVRRWTKVLDVEPTWLRHGLRALPVVVACAVSSFALGWNRFQEPLPLTAAWSRVFFQYGLQSVGNRTDLQRPVRMPLTAPARPGPDIDILVILNESLRADAFQPLPDSLVGGIDARAVAPRTQEWLADSLTWAFAHARSNATATAVSVSSWTTGVPPWGSTYQLHRSPTLFDVAHVAGRRTFLVTAQDWHWWHLDEFFFGPSLARVVDRRSFDAPKANDLGVDDALIVDSLERIATESDSPFVAVLQFNGTHGPYWPGPGRTDLPPSSRERYLAAVSYIDSVQDACLQALRRSGRLDRTLVIVVSDHSENLGSRDVARINSFYEESVRVPFWIRLPRRGLDVASARKALEAWKDRNVDLLDIAPTVLPLLGSAPGSPERQYQTGSSLLSPPPDSERVLGGQSTGDVRSWDIEGGYALRGTEKFVFHGRIGPQLFDLASDPREQRDLWTDPVRRARALEWLRPAFADPGRAALCRRAGPDCPEELRDLDRRKP